MSLRPPLDPSDYWREPSDEIEPGDVFVEIPLLSLRHNHIEEQDEAYLATRRKELALLLKIVPATWWFVPVFTPDSFRDRTLFNDWVEQTDRGQRPGWFSLPPLDPAYAPLAEPSLVCTLRPTLHRDDAFDDAHAMRVASLTASAYERVCQAFLEGFEEA